MKYTILANSLEWCKYSWLGALKDKNIHYIHDPHPFKRGSLMNFLWKIHYHFWGKHFFLPFKSIWYKAMLKSYGLTPDEQNRIILYDRNILSTDFHFWAYVRNALPDVKIVYLFSNVVRVSGASDYGIIEKLNDVFDIVFAFDKKDAERYSFSYNPLIYTEFHGEGTVKLPHCHLFYLGLAKDRLDDLIEIFEKAQKEGLKCDFHIVGVPTELQKYSDEIVYNKPMQYAEALNHIKAADCLVDIIQKNSYGLTIKTCEAVIYEKKLITSNQMVVEEKFYHPENIMVYNANANLKEFIEKPIVHYGEVGKNVFSPYNLFNEIE